MIYGVEGDALDPHIPIDEDNKIYRTEKTHTNLYTFILNLVTSMLPKHILRLSFDFGFSCVIFLFDEVFVSCDCIWAFNNKM